MVDRDNSRTIDDVAGWIAQTCIEVPSQDPRQGFLSGAARFLTKAVVANANNENGLWPNGQVRIPLSFRTRYPNCFLQDCDILLQGG